MGWYHFQLMDGKTPEEIEADMMCADGTCAARTENSGAQQETGRPNQDRTSTTASSSRTAHPACHDGTCYDTTAREEAAREELYDLAHGPIYHLCQKEKWLDAVRSRTPYFAPTFWLDGRFTRGSCVLDSLVGTANTYYKDIAGEWLVLQMDPHLLHQMGTMIAVHRAPESTREEEPVQCLKIHGGIPTAVPDLVTHIYRMQRKEDGTFVDMVKTGDIVPRMTTATIGIKPLKPGTVTSFLAPTSPELRHDNLPKEEASRTKDLKKNDEPSRRNAPGMKEARSWFRRRKLQKNTNKVEHGA